MNALKVTIAGFYPNGDANDAWKALKFGSV